MTTPFSFDCALCGETHEGSPSFGFDAPEPFLEQSAKTRDAGVLGSDLCEYEDSEGVHYFARVVIEIPIESCDDPFLWSVWVLLSEESFEHYVETYDAPPEDVMYFGQLCNSLPYYDDTFALAADVHPRPGDNSPALSLHKVGHELYEDFSQGLSHDKAQRIAQLCLHGE
ncbi:MAG: DUF2199 domain-containing protein [Halioglobus sp.]